MRAAIVFLAVVFAAGTGMAQGRRPYGRGTSPRQGGAPAPDVLQSALVEFQGILRNFDKKKVLLDREDGQTLVFRRTKHTQFVPTRGHSGIDLGVKVEVDAHRDSVGDLDAVRVCESACASR